MHFLYQIMQTWEWVNCRCLRVLLHAISALHQCGVFPLLSLTLSCRIQTTEGSEDRRLPRCIWIFCYRPIRSCNKMVAEFLSVLISFTWTMKLNNSQDECLPYGYISCLQRRLDNIQPPCLMAANFHLEIMSTLSR